MILLFISIFWLAVCVDSISADPHITVEVHVGSTALLPCNLNKVFTQTPHVLWRADNKVVFERTFNGTYEGPGYEGRVDVPEDELRKGNCSLVLKDVRFTDHTFYKSFKVEHVEETDSHKTTEINTVQLDVFQSVSAEVGSTAVLPCDCRNLCERTPHVKWSIGDETVFEVPDKESHQGEGHDRRVDVPKEELLNGNCSLVLKNVTVTDVAEYSASILTNNKTMPELVLKVKLSVYEKRISDPSGEAGGEKLKIIISIVCCVLIGLVIFILWKYRSKLLKRICRRSTQNIRNEDDVL